MFIAIACPCGQKWPVPETQRGLAVPCPACGAGVTAPTVTSDPAYNTVRLVATARPGDIHYRPVWDSLAASLYHLAHHLAHHTAPTRNELVVRENGSYSSRARSTNETLGKIVVYESDRGREIGGHFPALADGAYLWLRCNGRVVNRLWAPAFQHRHTVIFHRLNPMVTLGVTSPDPACAEERFAYFRLENADLPRWQDFSSFLVELTGL